MSKKKLKKPVPVTITKYDYSECAKYISQKLGYDIEDIGDDGLDFWGFLCEELGIENGSLFQITSSYLDDEDYEKIVKAFVEEFGEDANYECWW